MAQNILEWIQGIYRQGARKRTFSRCSFSYRQQNLVDRTVEFSRQRLLLLYFASLRQFSFDLFSPPTTVFPSCSRCTPARRNQYRINCQLLVIRKLPRDKLNLPLLCTKYLSHVRRTFRDVIYFVGREFKHTYYIWMYRYKTERSEEVKVPF